jgi:hypothetical protein
LRKSLDARPDWVYIFDGCFFCLCSVSLAESGSNRMSVDPANAHKLIQTAGETGVDVLVGHFCHPSKIAGSQPGDPHFRELLDRYRNAQLILMTMPAAGLVGPLGSVTSAMLPSSGLESVCGTVPRRCRAISHDRRFGQPMAARHGRVRAVISSEVGLLG